MRYTKLTGIILKKQNYREADQIITIFTEEAGKIRCQARGIRLAKSKLVYSLQDLSLVSIEITGRSFPTVINAQCIKQHKTLCEDLKKAAIAFYGAELVMKTTADEHPNAAVFASLKDFLADLNSADYSVRYHPFLESFSLKLLDSLGFKIPHDLDPEKIMDMNIDEIDAAHHTINKFVEFIIERNIKSEPFLISI